MFKDLFISYGRRESLGFVARLHQKIKLAGYEAWFDKVNIPGPRYPETRRVSTAFPNDIWEREKSVDAQSVETGTLRAGLSLG